MGFHRKKIQKIKKYLPETILSTKEKDDKKSISLNYDTCNLIYKYLSYSDNENLCEAARLSNLNKEKHSQDEFKKEKKQQQITQTPSLKEKIQFLPSCTQIKSRVNRIKSTLFSLPISLSNSSDEKQARKKEIKY